MVHCSEYLFYNKVGIFNETKIFSVRDFISCIAVLHLFHHEAFAGIKGTKHDLSVSGAGTIKALHETQTCIFCHTPHNADSCLSAVGS